MKYLDEALRNKIGYNPQRGRRGINMDEFEKWFEEKRKEAYMPENVSVQDELLDNLTESKEDLREAFHAAATSIFEELDKFIEEGEEYESGGVWNLTFNKNEYDALKRKYTNPSPEKGSSKSVEGKEEG